MSVTYTVGVRVESSRGHAYTATVHADTVADLVRQVRNACKNAVYMMHEKPGTIARIGNHAVALGDAFDAELRARLLPRPADLLLTDPPYAIYGSSTGVASDVADDQMVRPFFRQVCQFTRDAVATNAHAYIFCDWRSYPALAAGAKDARLAIKNLLVWDKMRPGVGTNYTNGHELIGFFANVQERRSMADAEKAQGVRPVPRSNVVKCRPVDPAKRHHNAEKPVALLQSFIVSSTDPDAVIFDPFLGSGSTAIAAHREGRRSVGIEIDGQTWRLAVSRLEDEVGENATMEEP